MSIAALQETSKELQRLAVAGSALGRDDFRLKRLVPELKKSGEKAPVFAKIAAAVEELLAADEATSARALLQAATLAGAVLATQLKHGADGDLTPLESIAVPMTSTPTAAKRIRAVIDALTETGGGRLEVVKEAHEAGLFDDLRLLKPALRAIADPYPEIVDYMMSKVLPRFGRASMPLVRAEFDPAGGMLDARRLHLMAQWMTPQERLEVVVPLTTTGSTAVRAAALESLGNDPACLDVIVACLGDKQKEVREASIKALGRQDTTEAFEYLVAALTSKDSEAAAEALQHCRTLPRDARLASVVGAYLDDLLAGKKGTDVRRLWYMVNIFQPLSPGPVIQLFMRMHRESKEITKLKSGSSVGRNGFDIAHNVEDALSTSRDPKATELLLEDADPKNPGPALAACIRTHSPAFVYERFSAALTGNAKSNRSRVDFISYFLRELGFDSYDSVMYLRGSTRYMMEVDPDAADEPKVGKIPWDSRWADDARRLGLHRLALLLLDPAKPATRAYALEEARESNDVSVMAAAMRSLSLGGYDKWEELLTGRLHAGEKRGEVAGHSRSATRDFIVVFRYPKLTDAELTKLEATSFALSKPLLEELHAQIEYERQRRTRLAVK